MPDDRDLCPETAPGATVDANGCSDAQVDQDLDGVCDPGAPSGGPSGCTGSDNCPALYNPDQADADGDGVGDACDADDDNDGYSDDFESYYGSDPLDPNSLVEVCNGLDNDGDGRFDEDLVDGIDNDADTLVDEDPTDATGTDDDGDTLVNEGYDYDANTIPDCLDIAADTDGDTIANPDDLDDDDDGDPDPGFNDGFEDWKENWMGTDSLDACPDDANDHAWPPDLNNDGAVNVLDLNGYRVTIGTDLGQGPNAEGRYYDRRFDFNADGSVNVLDVMAYRPVLGMSCTNP